MSTFVLNGNTAVRIKAIKIKESPGKKAVLMNCEGVICWFPMKLIKIEYGKATMLVEEWFYNQKVKEGIL